MDEVEMIQLQQSINTHSV